MCYDFLKSAAAIFGMTDESRVEMQISGKERNRRK